MDFTFKTFHSLAMSQNFEHAFDNLDALNIHVLDQILNVYDHQLKLLSPKHTEWDELHNTLINLYEDDYFIGLVWRQDHYQVVGKYGLLYVLFDPCYDYPIRHTYREFLEYVTSPGVLYFHIKDQIDEEYHLDWFLDEPVFGAGKRKKKTTGGSEGPSKRVRRVAGVRRSARRTRNTQESRPVVINIDDDILRPPGLENLGDDESKVQESALWCLGWFSPQLRDAL